MFTFHTLLHSSRTGLCHSFCASVVRTVDKRSAVNEHEDMTAPTMAEGRFLL